MSFDSIPASAAIAGNLEPFKTNTEELVNTRFDNGISYSDQALDKALETADAIKVLAKDLDTVNISLEPLDDLANIANDIRALVGELEVLGVEPGDLSDLADSMTRITGIIDAFDDPFSIDLDALTSAEQVIQNIMTQIYEIVPTDFTTSGLAAYTGAENAIDGIKNGIQPMQPVEINNVVLTDATKAIDKIEGMADDSVSNDPAVEAALRELDIDIPSISRPPIATTRPKINDFDINLGDLIPPVLSFVWAEEARYTSALRSLLESEISADLGGAQVISSTVEDAMMAREQERDLETLSDAKARVAAEWGEFNWPLPDGILVYNMNQLDIAHENKMLDKSRAIQEQTEKLALENMWKAREIGSQMERDMMVYVAGMMQRKLEAAKVEIEATVEMFKLKAVAIEAKMKMFLAMVDMYRADVDMAMKEMQLDITVVEANVRLKVAKAQLMVEKVRLLLTDLGERNRIKLGAAEAIQRVSEKTTDAKIEEGRMVIAQFTELAKIKLGAMDAIDKVVVSRTAAYGENVKLAINEYLEQMRLRMQGMNNIEGIVSSKAKTLMTQIGASVSQFSERIRARLTGVEAATKVGAIEENLLIENSRLQLNEFLENMKLKLGSAEILDRIGNQKAMLVIEKAKAEINQYLEQVRLKLGAMQAVAQTLSQVAAGAMAGISATAHISSSDSTATGATVSYQGQETIYRDETPNE